MTIIALVLDVPTLRIRAISALQLPDRPEPCAWSCDPLQVAVGPTGDHLVEVALIEPPFRMFDNELRMADKELLICGAWIVMLPIRIAARRTGIARSKIRPSPSRRTSFGAGASRSNPLRARFFERRAATSVHTILGRLAHARSARGDIVHAARPSAAR